MILILSSRIWINRLVRRSIWPKMRLSFIPRSICWIRNRSFSQLLLFILIFLLVYSSMIILLFTLVYTSKCYDFGDVGDGFTLQTLFSAIGNDCQEKKTAKIDNDGIENCHRTASWLEKYNVARYVDTCGKCISDNQIMRQSTSIPPNISNINRSAINDNNDFYFDQFRQNLSYVRLPEYSAQLSIANISDLLFLYSAFAIEQSDNEGSATATTTVKIIAIADRLFCLSQNPNDHYRSYTRPYSTTNWSLTCAFDRSSPQSSIHRSEATIECLPESHSTQFVTIFVRCKLPIGKGYNKKIEKVLLELEHETLLGTPSTQTISNSSDSIPIEYLPLESRGHNSFIDTNISDITVCVRPMFGSINVLNLLEFISFYQWHGISQIVFYHYEFVTKFDNSNGQEEKTTRWNISEKFLKWLQTLPGVELRPFRLPKKLVKKIHAGGQMATMHDCLQRHLESVQIHLDLDEFVDVRMEKERSLSASTNLRLSAFIASHLQSPISYVALYIANILHCHEFNLLHKSGYYEFNVPGNISLKNLNNNLESQVFDHFNLNSPTATDQHSSASLLITNNRHHQKTVWPHQYRSKVIVLRPRLVQFLGIHSVNRFVPDSRLLDGLLGTILWPFTGWFPGIYSRSLFTYLEVDPGQALLRHYRWCCHIEQPYFRHLLHFSPLDDLAIEPAPSVNEQQTTTVTTHIGNFVLENFRNYLTFCVL